MDKMIRVATTGGLLSWYTGQQQSDEIRKTKILIELTKKLDRLELEKRSVYHSAGRFHGINL